MGFIGMGGIGVMSWDVSSPLGMLWLREAPTAQVWDGAEDRAGPALGPAQNLSPCPGTPGQAPSWLRAPLPGWGKQSQEWPGPHGRAV